MRRKPVKQYRLPGSKQVGTLFIVRLDHYGKRLDLILELYAEAKKDFPRLKPSDVEVVQYGGRHIKGYHGIEFHLTADAPEGYEQVEIVENFK